MGDIFGFLKPRPRETVSLALHIARSLFFATHKTSNKGPVFLIQQTHRRGLSGLGAVLLPNVLLDWLGARLPLHSFHVSAPE